MVAGRRFVDRIGAALVAPRAALAASDGEGGQGTAPGDLALLLALGFVAMNVASLVSIVWLAVAGSAGVAFHAFVQLASRDLAGLLVLLFIASFTLWIAAGNKRSLGADFDLAAVAFVPAVAVHLVAALVASFGVAGRWLDLGTAIVAYGWAVVVLGLAWQQARSRGADEVAA